jgi:hypothetical protein
MSKGQSVRIAVRCVDNLTDQLEAVYNRVTRKAYEQWLSRSTARVPLSESLPAAQRDLLMEPQTGVREWGHGVIVEMDCSEVEPAKIRLFITRTELLALAPLKNSGTDKWLFRHLWFAAELDALDATAEVNGTTLRISATWLNAPEEEKLRSCVA